MIIFLILKEILYRKLNFLLAVLAVATAASLFVFFFTTSEASKRETIRLTRDMGFNLRIIPGKTDMDEFWIRGFSEYTMPEEYVYRFTSYKDFSFAHLTATLHKRVKWRNREIILTGISSEIEPSGIPKTPMIYIIKPKTVYIGFEVAKSLNLNEGDEIEIFGKSFTVAKTLSESGSQDDIRIYAPLKDVQEVLEMNGEINEIIALNCLCLTSDEEDPVVILRAQLAEVLPDAKVILNRTIAVAREKQRLMLENYFAIIIPFVVIACALWIGTMAMMNVRERRHEIGLLRALGYGGGKIAVLFLGKAVLYGILGALLGYTIGTLLSLSYGPDIFKVTAKAIKPLIDLFGWSILAAMLFAGLSALLPTMTAITQDPAQTLRGQ